ncbi:MAG: hypothetical protein H0W25_01050 [Acidimicrobiia bacterium]|nr:hypothetical protein [Acidimicrobiia bacterium]
MPSGPPPTAERSIRAAGPTPPDATGPGAVLVMGDFGHERCGVGGSMAALVAGRTDIAVLDAAAPGRLRFLREARAAARTGAVAVAVYPTRSTVYQRDLLLRAAVVRLAFGRRRFRLHLHEYRHLRKMLRWPATIALLLPQRIVVSTESERDAVARALGGLVGRRCEVVVAVPTSGTSPTATDLEASLGPDADRDRTVGVFGMYRDDKDLSWLLDVLGRLDRRFDRLVLAGAGWEGRQWPSEITDRYELTALGHVPRRALPGIFRSWGLAVAPLSNPAHDGRMSVRTPLAFGVPTLTVGPRDAELTLDPPHLVLVPPHDPGAARLDVDRGEGAAAVAEFERAAGTATAAALFG